MDKTKFLDVYDDEEMRRLYAAMFPGLLFDEDCWFPFAEAGGRRLLLDGSLSLALTTGDPEAAHYSFYTQKGEERIRAVQGKCEWKNRAYVDEANAPAPKDGLPITVGVTNGAKIPQS